MKKIIQYINTLLVFTMLISNSASAQMEAYARAKEKIYIQTNHVFFKQGEELFFKLYLVSAQDQTPSHTSSIVYVEIINPAGSTIQKLNYQVANGYTEGSFLFDEQVSGGVYKIKAYTTLMQNETDSTFFTKEITVQKVISPRILMKLDLPKKGYGAGDEVSADYAVRNLADKPIANQEAKYTVSIGGNVTGSGTFKTDDNGKAKIKFLLPDSLATTDGLVNVTMLYDSYTEAISRSIPIVLNKIDLQFMPEGGSIINGLAATVAFKALNENGKAADITGEIWDDKGNKVADFESYHMGMGKFSFTPEAGKTYVAKITSPSSIKEQFALPPAKDDGVVINFTKENNLLFATLWALHKTEVNLVGQTKNNIYFTQHIILKKGSTKIAIDTKPFPAGIAAFTLYTVSNMPLAERLVFLNEEKILRVNIIADKEKYLPREKVSLTLQTFDEKGKPVPSNFSMAVVDDKLWTFADDKQDHILSWLLLSSELKGKIEEPQFYFKKEEIKAVPSLDLLMLTHGYRYFDFIEYVQKENKLKYTPDVNNIISGVVLNEKEQPAKAEVFLIENYTGGKATKIKTGDDGTFYFSGIRPNGDYYVVARSLSKKEKVSVKVLQNGIGYNPMQAMPFKQSAAADKQFNMMVVQVANKKVADDSPGKKEFAKATKDGKVARLEEVVVTAAGIRRSERMLGYSVARVDPNVLLQKAEPDVLKGLQGKVAGVDIRTIQGTPGAATRIQIRGNAAFFGDNQPLIVVNGAPYSKSDLALNPNDIQSMTILKGNAAAALYGSRASNGVILIESKNYRTENIRMNVSKNYYYASQMVKASNIVYAVARKFYAPKYTSLETAERNDFRETIYWNPVVQTDNSGTAKVEFYNSDASTTFRAIAEGIDFAGKLGRVEKTYAVQNAMSADAKIPPYLTVGDKALLPLVIKNNSEKSLLLSINAELPQNIRGGNFDHSLTLEAGSSKQLLIPVEAVAATKGNIKFIVASQFNTETLVLPISATDKGFPVVETFSGNSSAKNNFSINKMEPGTLHAQLKLFKSLEGQLLDGIESMLREPGGCFEQTSSSTYPNIYVLKYLKESGKSNPEIVNKAMGYIERGYKRLIGFETKENGFEWFGRTPPHPALTAYGLLEFTDMQDFIDVDKAMLARTKAYLLSIRDGKGCFKPNQQGLDAFASVPDKVANTYIVYSLTQAGTGKEIEPEYRNAVSKALDSNDGYQMAMMAIAAGNMKNKKDYDELMEKLNNSYQKTKLHSETSVVNSRDASLRVETMALYALALTRATDPQVGKIAEVISAILAEKSYYGYGSTQATVLALHAIVEYGKLIGNIAANVQVDFELNAEKIKADSTLNSMLKEGSNSFTVHYKDESKNVPYNLEVAYSTFVPPNSDKAVLLLNTTLKNSTAKVGETTRMDIEVKNVNAALQPMAIAKIGIPAGLSVQPWQLKEIMEKNKVAYYEMFDNYLVFYWMGFAPNETKTISLDLKAEIPGTYKAKASNVYLYYTPEHKNWNEGATITVQP